MARKRKRTEEKEALFPRPAEKKKRKPPVNLVQHPFVEIDQLEQADDQAVGVCAVQTRSRTKAAMAPKKEKVLDTKQKTKPKEGKEDKNIPTPQTVDKGVQNVSTDASKDTGKPDIPIAAPVQPPPKPAPPTTSTDMAIQTEDTKPAHDTEPDRILPKKLEDELTYLEPPSAEPLNM